MMRLMALLLLVCGCQQQGTFCRAELSFPAGMSMTADGTSLVDCARLNNDQWSIVDMHSDATEDPARQFTLTVPTRVGKIDIGPQSESKDAVLILVDKQTGINCSDYRGTLTVSSTSPHIVADFVATCQTDQSVASGTIETSF